ncbi:MAG: type II toxin-antitoxin system RelE/ParE family toxin [Firmicutes bacterium]|nr:type II toxin-antitoxin system RelE/ParE family toxin [Bacillota bacterium]
MVKKQFKVIWSKRSRASLQGIYKYIKKRESQEQAAKVRDEIRDLGRSLGFMPHKYAKDLLTNEEYDNIRYKVIWSYRIIYEIREDAIAILDVVHTSRNPENIKLVR